MGDLVEIETHKLYFPWSISKGKFQKFRELNSTFNSIYIDKHCIEVPEETSIDLSPLIPLLPIHISTSSPTFAKPIPELIKFNQNLRIETLNSTIINIKSGADLPTRQNGELSRQLHNFTKANGLIGPNDSSSLFHLQLLNIKLGPDVGYFPRNQHNDLNIEVKKKNTTPIPPSFVIENRSYSLGQNNNREYQKYKMCLWIEGGSQSGLLIDGNSRMIDVYCNLNLLQPIVNQPNTFVHPQVQGQRQESLQQQVQLQNRILLSQQTLLALPANSIQQIVTDDINSTLKKLNIINNFNHVYFENMMVVPNHPKVCSASIPFWPPNQIIALPEYGPNIIIHCIGDVNGFNLDLSSLTSSITTFGGSNKRYFSSTTASEVIELDKLRNEITKYNQLYYNESKSEISDYDYDMKFKRLQHLEKKLKDIKVSNQVGFSSGGTDKQKVHHRVRMLSLDNTYSLVEIESFRNKIKKFLIKNHNLSQIGTPPIEYTVELKYDGIAISLLFQNSKLQQIVTRGDGEYGEDITENAIHFINNLQHLYEKEIKLNINGKSITNFEIRGEVVLNKNRLKGINEIREKNGEELYKNTRNIVSGILRKNIDINNLGELDNIIRFDLFAYNLILHDTDSQRETTHYKNLEVIRDQCKLTVDPNVSVFSTQDPNDIIEKWYNKRMEYPYDIDGLVFKVNSIELQEQLGELNRSPRWAFAYKFPANGQFTKVLSVSTQVGKSGVLTPVATLTPIELNGVTVSRVTLNNFPFIEKNQIGLGSNVFVVRSGDVIPKILMVKNEGDEHGKVISPPLECPCELKCKDIVQKGQEYFCVNKKCPNQRYQQICWFVSKNGMDIEGVGPAQVQVFLDNGFIEDPGDLYLLHKYRDKLLQIKGFNETKVQNILNAIEDSKSRGLRSLLSALNIPGVGKASANILSESYLNLDHLIGEESSQDIKCRTQLGSKICDNIYDFFHPLSSEESKEYIDQLIYKIKLYNLNQQSLNYTPSTSSDVIKNTNHTNINNNNKNNININSSNNNNYNKLNNSKVVISGIFSKIGNREYLEKLIQEKFKCKIQKSINQSTNFLIIGADPSQLKIDKSKSISSCQLLTESDLLDLLK
ncbi:hypothetical protein DLAC_00157 [Tieghemostelium lacteum]|uniref:DNA ligase (NAD(+)) n=1 Tax=Tieghemostelium lacteum TaxID=361077 RepID=A0A152A900_TIELA|nr:hypothetical protein DLAC_00157 [Tieghemostelium lacteum]|eukprot:KYR02698.1 hypothetical protein DLAC_00157 [Tieghemostelium lacteum]